jgi:hypothetical protein
VASLAPQEKRKLQQNGTSLILAIVDVRLANGDLGTDVAAFLRRTTKDGIIFSTGDGNDLSIMAPLGDAVTTKPYRRSDVGRGLKSIDEIARLGHSAIIFPRNFRLLIPVAH